MVCWGVTTWVESVKLVPIAQLYFCTFKESLTLLLKVVMTAVNTTTVPYHVLLAHKHAAHNIPRIEMPHTRRAFWHQICSPFLSVLKRVFLIVIVVF